MTEPGNRRQKWLLCVLLAAAVLVVYGQALRCEFVNFDDGDYVTRNPNVQRGLTWESIQWALTTDCAANWHPVTWMSHCLDCQLYGLNPTGHHLTSLLLHAANAVLLFLLLNRMTGALWASAWVAALFALHPLRAESVVWVAERKDVLSTFFWMLAAGAYVRYVNPPSPRLRRTGVFYGLSLLFFALGLMSKPMVVTLPFVLLLLDYWPLRRLEFGARFSWRLMAEKIPFLLLAAGSSAATFLVQHRSGVVTSFSKLLLSARLSNAVVSYARYLGKIFWPFGLAVFYGYERWRFYQVAGAVLLLGLITAWAVWQMRARPYLAVGWFWFLGMLVPTIGLVQVGHQSMADRYSYLPSVGILLMVAWGLSGLAARHALLLKAVAMAGALALAACAMLTVRQISFWKNPVALFSHAADVSDQDYMTCYNVGCQVMQQGNLPRAARCFERALKVAGKDAPPSFLARAENNLGCVLLEQGRIPNSISNFESALLLQPAFPQAYYNMGRAFLSNRQPDVAVESFQHALALDQNPAVMGALASAYAASGNFRQAAATAQRARQIALARNNRALAGALELQARQYQLGNGGVPP